MRHETPIVFLHIPKTAGSSFTHILKSLFDDADIFHEMDVDLLKEELSVRPHAHRLYIGHYSWEVIGLFERRPRLLTFLREPGARILSHYHYYRIQTDEAVARMPPWDREIVELVHKHGFAELIGLDHPAIERGFANVHTRQLATSTYYDPPLERGAREGLLATAMAHLEEIEFVGIAERFEESLQLFGRRFCPDREIAPVYHNVNADKAATPADLEVFDADPVARRRVELDNRLYRQGLALFESRLKGRDSRLRRALSRLFRPGEPG